MTYIAPRTEKLARAMCEAVLDGIDPDKKVPGLVDPPEAWHPNWMAYRWPAQKWIYEHSGGKLPEREEE